MQNIDSSGKTLKDLQKFPDVFTFKIMGENTNQFSADAKKIFDGRNDVNFAENISRTGKYISISVTTEVWTYEELESLYTAVSKLSGNFCKSFNVLPLLSIFCILSPYLLLLCQILCLCLLNFLLPLLILQVLL